MRRFLFAALAAVALVCSPARAQQQTVWYSGVGGSTVTGSLVTGPTDVVVADLVGSRWATARWAVTTAGTATITTEYSNDGGVNWLASAWSKRLDTVSANPSVSPWSNNTPVAGSVWETPLPANATNFRLRCGTTGTTTAVTVSGGTPYTPGAPVEATLFDTTSAVNTAIDTGILDTAGWNGLSVTFVTPAGGSGAIKAIDDTGTASTPNQIVIPASAGVVINLTPYGTTLGTPGTSGSISAAWRWKRTQMTSAAVAALTSRIRIEAWR